MSEPVLVAIIAIIGGALLGPVISWLLNRRRDQAVTEVSVSQAWQPIVNELRKDVADQQREIVALQTDVKTLKEDLRRERGAVEALTHKLRIVVRWATAMRRVLEENSLPVPKPTAEVEDALIELIEPQ